MERLEVLISISGKVRTVDAWKYVPGLMVHKNPNPKKDDFWVTHQWSGLPLLVEVPGSSVPWVKAQLTSISWCLPAEEIYESNDHRNLIIAISETMGTLTKSDKQEIRIAEDMGGKRSPASGALPGLKRDQRNLRFLVESKTTDSSSFRIDLKDLAYLERQAYTEGKTPAYAVQIKQHEEVVLVPENEVYALSGEEADPDHTVAVESKTLGINERLVKAVINGTSYRFIIDDEPYLLLNYEQFLAIAKP